MLRPGAPWFRPWFHPGFTEIKKTSISCDRTTSRMFAELTSGMPFVLPFPSGNCENGAACAFCHLPHENKGGKPNKKQRDFMQSLSHSQFFNLISALCRERAMLLNITQEAGEVLKILQAEAKRETKETIVLHLFGLFGVNMVIQIGAMGHPRNHVSFFRKRNPLCNCIKPTLGRRHLVHSLGSSCLWSFCSPCRPASKLRAVSVPARALIPGYPSESFNAWVSAESDRVEVIALRFEAVTRRLVAVASRLDATASRLKAIASGFRAIPLSCGYY